MNEQSMVLGSQRSIIFIKLFLLGGLRRGELHAGGGEARSPETLTSLLAGRGPAREKDEEAAAANNMTATKRF